MELKLPSTSGARPPKKKMIFLPKVSKLLRLPLRNPSPTPASSSSEPTPQAIPNMVRKDRSLCAQRVLKICAKVSRSMRMVITSRSQGTACAEMNLSKRRPLLLLRLAEGASVSAHFVGLATEGQRLDGPTFMSYTNNISQLSCFCCLLLSFFSSSF